MTTINTIFGKDKNIYRPIDKVVTFGNATNENLKNEISEYVVTERLKDNFEKILDALYNGMEGGTNEVGIWVSGFYGSGKSSFAKYLGFALKKDLIVDGQSFVDRLGNRINSLPITQTFKTIIEKHDPAIILLDCATEQIKGGTLPPILELLIAKVYQLAGFSTDSQLANLERMLQRDSNFEKFVNRIRSEYDKDWDDIKINDQLRAKGIASKLAAEMYPEIWTDDKAFKITKVDDMRSDKQKVEDLLATITQITGKKNIIFIVDEVGQYISAKDSLILSLQGTMENLKDIAKGRAWLLATAQQTLTEDNPNARLNSDKLYKLNARFPVKAEIEASDIKEICTQRLLGKSSDASAQLKSLYKNHGEKLRHFTKLENCERTMYVRDSLDEKLFVDLYPFLPHHFEIILSLLGRLAKITGGVGLRSAIKVIQDVLTDTLPSETQPLAEETLGKLACAYHIYDVLKADIRKSYSHVVAAVDKIVDVYGNNCEQTKVAKSIWVLQLLDDFHLSTKNLAVVMHPSVATDSILKQISDIVNELKKMPGCTLNEIDGQLRFMTEAITNIEIEKSKIKVIGNETRKVYEDIIKDIYTPVPQARLHNTRTVRSGVNLNLDLRIFKLLETTEEIQLEVVFVDEAEYPQKAQELSLLSTERTNGSRIYLLGKLEDKLDDDVIEIVKCEGIFGTRNRYTDKEIMDYLSSQDQQATILKEKIKRSLIQAFEKGEFIFRGTNKPVKSYGSKLRESTNSKLKDVAEIVFDKYIQAAISIPSSDAEKLLQFSDIRTLPQSANHFDLVKSDGSIDLNHSAIISIREYIEKEGHVEGRNLLEFFEAAPYGWSKDTTRFLATIMFIASDIKLRISGDDIKVKGPIANEALKNVNGFNRIGISLYDKADQPTMEMLALSVRRLAELTGETVAPLQNKIAEVVRKHFPVFQTRYSAVKSELENLGLPGIIRAKDLQDGIEEVLKGDGADAAFKLGKDESDLYSNLKWVKRVHDAFESGVKKHFLKAIELCKSISELPDSGIPMELKENTKNDFERVEEIRNDEDFFDRIPDLIDAISNIKSLASDYCQKLLAAENGNIQNEIELLKTGQIWSTLKTVQQEELSGRLNSLVIQNKQGIEGIKEILNAAYSLNNSIKVVNEQIKEYAKSKETSNPDHQFRVVDLTKMPKHINKIEDIDKIIAKLEEIKKQLKDNESIELYW